MRRIRSEWFDCIRNGLRIFIGLLPTEQMIILNSSFICLSVVLSLMFLRDRWTYIYIQICNDCFFFSSEGSMTTTTPKKKKNQEREWQLVIILSSTVFFLSLPLDNVDISLGKWRLNVFEKFDFHSDRSIGLIWSYRHTVESWPLMIWWYCHWYSQQRHIISCVKKRLTPTIEMRNHRKQVSEKNNIKTSMPCFRFRPFDRRKNTIENSNPT